MQEEKNREFELKRLQALGHSGHGGAGGGGVQIPQSWGIGGQGGGQGGGGGGQGDDIALRGQIQSDLLAQQHRYDQEGMVTDPFGARPQQQEQQQAPPQFSQADALNLQRMQATLSGISDRGMYGELTPQVATEMTQALQPQIQQLQQRQQAAQQFAQRQAQGQQMHAAAQATTQRIQDAQAVASNPGVVTHPQTGETAQYITQPDGTREQVQWQRPAVPGEQPWMATPEGIDAQINRVAAQEHAAMGGVPLTPQQARIIYDRAAGRVQRQVAFVDARRASTDEHVRQETTRQQNAATQRTAAEETRRDDLLRHYVTEVRGEVTHAMRPAAGQAEPSGTGPSYLPSPAGGTPWHQQPQRVINEAILAEAESRLAMHETSRNRLRGRGQSGQGEGSGPPASRPFEETTPLHELAPDQRATVTEFSRVRTQARDRYRGPSLDAFEGEINRAQAIFREAGSVERMSESQLREYVQLRNRIRSIATTMNAPPPRPTPTRPPGPSLRQEPSAETAFFGNPGL